MKILKNLENRTIKIEKEDLLKWADAVEDHNKIHTDIEEARAYRLPDTPIHGTLQAALLEQSVRRVIKPESPQLYCNRYNIRFMKQVYPGDELLLIIKTVEDELKLGAKIIKKEGGIFYDVCNAEFEFGRSKILPPTLEEIEEELRNKAIVTKRDISINPNKIESYNEVIGEDKGVIQEVYPATIVVSSLLEVSKKIHGRPEGMIVEIEAESYKELNVKNDVTTKIFLESQKGKEGRYMQKFGAVCYQDEIIIYRGMFTCMSRKKFELVEL